jgi:hypothetical protein
MPLPIPEGRLTKANWLVPILKPFLDALETAAASALSTASSAATTAASAAALAGQKFTMPAGGLLLSHLSTALQALINGKATALSLRYEYMWNGTAYVDKLGGAIPATRVPGTLRGFTGPANPKTLGLMEDVDRWTDPTL